MKIGLNGYYFSALYSGIGQYTINLIKSLAEIAGNNNNYKFYIFTPIKFDINLPNNFNIKIIPPISLFSKSFLNRFIWEEYQLGLAIKKYKIDVFHGLYQSLPKNSEKIANVVTIHDAIPWKFPFERKQFSYRLYSDIRKNLVKKRAKKIITVSETSKLDFAPIYEIKPETIEVTYQSIDPIFWEKPSKTEVQKFKDKYNYK